MVGARIKTPTSSTPPTPAPKPRAPAREGGARRGEMPAPAIRIAISVLIVWHVAAIFLAAVSIPGPTSPLVINIAQGRPMQWYLDALYLNQGHSFFAPDVGPGHMIRYTLLDQSGREIEHGDFPSRKEHWPRLLYHRYFMLADQSDFPTDDKTLRDEWQRKYLQAYARHLLDINPTAQSVRVQRYAHFPPPRSYFVDNTGKLLSGDSRPSLTDPKGYQLLMDVTERRTTPAPLPQSQSMYRQQGPPQNPNQNQNMYWQQARPNVDTARRWSGGPR